MKRFLSLVLAAVMLLSTLSSLAFTVSAGVVESFSYEPAEPIELIQNERLWLEGDSVLYYVYDYEDEALPKLGDTITVNYTDGSSEVLTFSQGDEYYEWMKSSGDTVEIDLFLSDDQGYENQWGLGTHYATVHCFGKEATIQVTIVESPVESVSFVCDSPIEVIENMDGISQTDYFDYDYDTALREKDKLIKVGYKDGTEKEFAYQGWSRVKAGGAGLTRYSAHFSDVESGEDAYGYIYDLQRIEPWGLGTNYITVSYLGVSVQVPVTIRENPVESIEFTPAKSYELIENSGGYFEDWYNSETEEWETKYFYDEYRIDDEGNILTVNFTDGSSVDYISTESGGWKSSNGEYLYGSPDCYDYQSINPWTIDGENYFVVKYMNKEVQVPVTVVAKGEDDGEDTINLVLNQENTVPSECTGIFIPEESGYYRFVSNGYGDPKITIKCLGGEYTFDDDDGWDFHGTVYLEAGETANCYLYNYADDENCVFTITKVVAPESVLVNFVEPIEIIENTNGYWESYEIWNEELDGYEEFDFYVYDIPFQYYEGNTITLNYADGTSDVYTCEGTGYFNSSGDLLIFEEYADQSYENRWTIGSDNYFTINVLGAETQVPVTIVEDPVESISYTINKPIEIIENTNGYWEEGEFYDSESQDWIYKEYFEYYIPDLDEYISVFTVNYTDGTSEDFSWDEDEWEYYSDDGECFEFRTSEQQNINPWVIGGNNSFRITAYNKEVDIPVTIVENPIKSISYAPIKPIKLNEKIDGRWQESYYWEDEYFKYDTSKYDICKAGDILTVTYSDGTVTEYICSLPDEDDSDGYGVYFTDSEENALPNSDRIDFSDEQSYSNQWTAGNEYEITLSYMGRTTTIPVAIIENSIESISYTSSESQFRLEGQGVISDYYYSETDEEIEWDRYEYWQCQGDILTINYTDGTKKDFYYDGNNYLSGDGDLIDGDRVKFFDDQSYTNQWTVGNSYEFTVSYAGKETKLPIKIVGIESYSFTLAEPIVLYQGYHLSDDGYFIDEFEEGNIFTIHYTDGSKTDYICGFNESKGYSGWFDENGKELDGYLESSAVGSENWEIGEHTATLIYRDYLDGESLYEIEIEVSLIENPVESVSVDLDKTIEYIEGIDSVPYKDSNGVLYKKYSPNIWDIPYGSTVTVNFKDGTNEVYILKEIWDEEYMQYYPELETEDGKRLKGYDWDVDSDEETNHWAVGENYFTLSVYGVSTQVPVLVKENTVESFYINYGNEIVYEENTNGWYETDYKYDTVTEDEFLVEYYMYDYWLGENGWELVVNYKDGTSDTFVCNVLEDYETGSSTQWTNASGEYLNVSWSSDQSYDNQWGIGTHYVTVSCLGKIIQIPIKIVANENCNHSYANGFCSVCRAEDASYSIPTLNVGESKTAIISNGGDSYYFYFSPEKSGVYSFLSMSDKDTYGYIYDSEFNCLISNDDAGPNANFKVARYLEAGKKYIIKCGFYSSSKTGSFDVSCDYDFYTLEGTKIIENYMFIPCFKTLFSDFVSVSDKISLDCTASCIASENNYFGTGSEFNYTDEYENNYGYTIIVEGDLNGDSVCDVIDAAVAQLYSAGFYEPSENETYAANGGLIDEFDVNSYQNVVNCALSS